MDLNSDTEAGVIAGLAREATAPTVVDLGDGRKYLVVPDGARAEDVTDPHGLTPVAPRRIKGRILLQEVDSLVEYANRFKDPNTVLFADITASRILAALDYHAPDKAGFVDHLAVMELPHSEEWKLWTGINGKMLGQLEFARHIEENAADIESPAGADLLETVRDLQAIRKADFRKAVRTSSDNENFEYSEETNATTRNGNVEVPSKFGLRLPVYFNGASTPLMAYLRWALDDGTLKLGIRLHQPEQVRQAVFKEIVADVASRTDLLPVFGKPAP